ncbi:MAG: type VI secretion system ImpA family N-terminal domain-containing protein [Polyangiaceae bacterium]
MGLTNNEQLVQPISEAAPAGENLEYDPAFLALERSAQGKPEQRMGASVVPGEPPEWGSVSSQAQALLGRTEESARRRASDNRAAQPQRARGRL